MMDLATRKYNFIQQIFDIDENLLDELELVFSLKKSSKQTTIEQYNIELNQANQRIENGDFYSTDEVKEITSKW